jgi:hypothetical protein
MTMQLEGDSSFERVQTRRWVSIVAFVVPVAAFVLLGAWFVRVYILPPTVNIPSLIAMATAPLTPSVQPMIEPPQAQAVQAEPPQPAQSQMTKSQMANTGPAAPLPAPERREAAPAMPMFATLAVVPPAIGSAPAPAFTDPSRDISAAAPAMSSEQPGLDPSEPISGPVPLPHARPQARVALITSQIPLPRPRPVETTTTPDDLPAVDRHAIE